MLTWKNTTKTKNLSLERKGSEMTTNEVMDVVDQHLQEANHDQKGRLKRINELMDFLAFNKRMTELSDEERLDFVRCEDGLTLTEEQRNLLELKPHKREYYIEEWARGTYFRLCDWRRYLFGETSEKPTVRSPQSATGKE